VVRDECWSLRVAISAPIGCSVVQDGELRVPLSPPQRSWPRARSISYCLYHVLLNEFSRGSFVAI